jgi:hypothetical protein
VIGGIFRQIYRLGFDNVSKDSFRKPHDQLSQAPILFLKRFDGEFHSRLVMQTLGPERWLTSFGDHSFLPLGRPKIIVPAKMLICSSILLIIAHSLRRCAQSACAASAHDDYVRHPDRSEPSGAAHRVVPSRSPRVCCFCVVGLGNKPSDNRTEKKQNFLNFLVMAD